MRFLIREQEYETPLAAGRFQYRHNGQPIGTYENWRVTELAGGYRFLRIDMDSREASRDESTLYHMLLDPNGRPERLKLRMLALNQELQADIIFEDNSIVVTGEDKGRRFEDELQLDKSFGFYFPTAMGYSMLLRSALDQNTTTAATFSKEHTCLLNQGTFKILPQQDEVLEVVRQQIAVHSYLIQWTDQENKVWIDNYRWPLRIDYGDDQVARETQYIRYR